MGQEATHWLVAEFKKGKLDPLQVKQLSAFPPEPIKGKKNKNKIIFFQLTSETGCIAGLTDVGPTEVRSRTLKETSVCLNI